MATTDVGIGQPAAERTPAAVGVGASARAERNFLRVGAACALIGGVLALVFNILHPRSSDIGEVEVELRLIEDHGEWLFVHVGILVAVFFLLPALVAITRSLLADTGALWARTALYSGVAALAIGFITVALDGIAMKELADDWAAASGAAQADILRTADAVGEVVIATFDVFIIAFAGLTPIFAGLAFLGSRLYPRWLGPVALGAGLLGLVTGLVQSFTGLTDVTANVLFPIASLAFTVVILVAGATLWRKADVVAGTVSG